MPCRPPAGVLPAIIAQICLKHPWIISIWLIIHGPACWATVNKVTLFFIWLHSDSHVSKAHNDRSSWGYCHSSTSFCLGLGFALNRWSLLLFFCLTDGDLFLSVWGFLCTVQLFQEHDPNACFAVKSQRSITDRSPCVCSTVQPGSGEQMPVSCLQLLS